jgi:hypothetical protein
MKVKCLLTFDYELYFGNNFLSEDEVLFQPTINILDLASKLNIKLVFFIDVGSLFIYEKFRQSGYVEKFIQQIKRIKESGHDIQMHFHPHWRDSIYDDKSDTWIHNYSNWSFSDLIHNFGIDEANIIFDLYQKKFIEVVGCKPIAFRAGGYSIQPNEKDLINALKKHNYKYDSSVFPFHQYVSDAQNFNHMSSPTLNYWKISSNSFMETGNSKLIEIPRFSLKKNSEIIYKYAFYKLRNKFYPKKNYKKRGHGATLKPKLSKSNSFSFSFDNVGKKDKKIIELLSNKYIDEHNKNEEVILNILSHPKAMTYESVEILEWYIEFMKKTYDCKFIGFDDLNLI